MLPFPSLSGFRLQCLQLLSLLSVLSGVAAPSSYDDEFKLSHLLAFLSCLFSQFKMIIVAIMHPFWCVFHPPFQPQSVWSRNGLKEGESGLFPRNYLFDFSGGEIVNFTEH